MNEGDFSCLPAPSSNVSSRRRVYREFALSVVCRKWSQSGRKNMKDSKSTAQTLDIDDRDDIDLIELMVSLYKARLTIGLTSLVFALASFAVTVFKPYQYEGRLPVYPLNQLETIGFTDWNNRLRIIASGSANYPKSSGLENDAPAPSVQISNVPLTTLPQVTSRTLYNEFSTHFSRLKEVRQAIRANAGEIFGSIEDPKVLTDREIQLSQSFKFRKTENSSEIVFTIPGPQLGTKIIDEALNNLFTTTKQNSLRLIAAKLELARQTRENRVTSIRNELVALENEYDLNKQRALKILREQADIARKLGYAKPLDANDARYENIDNRYPQTLKPFYNTLYTQGYLALEEQIKKIESREEIRQTPLSASVDPILFYKYLLEADDTIEQLAAVAAELPYHDPAFSLVKYDLSELTFQKKGSDLMTIIASVFLGIIVGCIAALTKNAFATRRKPVGSLEQD